MMEGVCPQGEVPLTHAELKQLYEKLYFLEIESREKIHARLQIPLTLLLALLGGIVFVLQNFDYQAGGWTPTRVTFAFFFCCAIVALIVGTVCFVFALYNHAYLFLPTPQKTADYKTLLEETYKDYEQHGQLVSDALDTYLMNYYVQYATHNTQVNDRRSAYIHLQRRHNRHRGALYRSLFGLLLR